MREIASKFPKPSYYAGLEDGIVIKDKDSLSLHIALAYPDLYEVGMSYLGQKILYNIVNDVPRWHAERVMCPDWEAAKILRQNNVPLATLETDSPLRDLDAVGFSVTHELCFTDILHMLDLAQIPLRASERGDELRKIPLIIAGGGAILGAESLSPFIDLAALGDGEEVLPELLTLLEKAHSENWSKTFFLEQASYIPGIYVPSLFAPDACGKLQSLRSNYHPSRRIVTDLNKAKYPAKQVSPISAVHNRLSLEIARGCTRGCRFCHAGIVYRPPRERNLEELGKILDECLDATGYDEVSFLSLSAGDYSALKSLYKQSFARCAQEQITLSLPSLRVGSVGPDILQKMASLRRTGMTLAPEAGTQRLRDVINKGITEEELLAHVKLLGELGWDHVKFYFMIGLPTETDEDLQGIFELCKKAQAAGSATGRKMRITASVAAFTPKAFTPFQWEGQISLEEMRRRIFFLRDLFKTHKRLQLRWHEPAASHLEGILSRSDRRLANVVEKAYKKGAIYCSWREFFNLQPWLEALEEEGLSADEYTGPRQLDKKLAWEHLECGVSKDFLLKERMRAYSEETSPDCRYGKCGNCGACDRGENASLLAKSAPEEKSYCRLVFPKRDQDQENLSNLNFSSENIQESFPLKADLTSRFQYRLWYKKLGAFSLLSQLELQTIFEKALRRSHMPLAFSLGFHPLPKISFGRALPVGLESHAEWLALTLVQKLEPAAILEALNKNLSTEINVFTVEYTESRKRTEQAIKELFRIKFPDKASFYKGCKAFSSFSSKNEFQFTRMSKKGEKNYNVRAMLESWEALSEKNAILFYSQWQNEYLSPLQLVNTIVGYDEKVEAMGLKISKLAQIFADGRSYGQCSEMVYN